jgi:hypothetical protein
MEFSFLGFMEMFIVLAFAVGWAVLELVGLRFDRRRKEEAKKAEAARPQC